MCKYSWNGSLWVPPALLTHPYINSVRGYGSLSSIMCGLRMYIHAWSLCTSSQGLPNKPSVYIYYWSRLSTLQYSNKSLQCMHMAACVELFKVLYSVACSIIIYHTLRVSFAYIFSGTGLLLNSILTRFLISISAALLSGNVQSHYHPGTQSCGLHVYWLINKLLVELNSVTTTAAVHAVAYTHVHVHMHAHMHFLTRYRSIKDIGQYLETMLLNSDWHLTAWSLLKMSIHRSRVPPTYIYAHTHAHTQTNTHTHIYIQYTDIYTHTYCISMITYNNNCHHMIVTTIICNIYCIVP